MSYEMGSALGETAAELQTVLLNRGHAVRSKTECSSEQYESMQRLQEALARADAVTNRNQAYEDTLRRTLYTYNETNRRCTGRWAIAAPSGFAPSSQNQNDGGSTSSSAGGSGAATSIAVVGAAGALVVGGLLFYRWRKKRSGR